MVIISNTIETSIKLSDLRKVVIGHNSQFLCHALVDSVGGNWENHVADEEVLFEEIKRIIGDVYTYNDRRGFLSDWIKNMPENLRKLKHMQLGTLYDNENARHEFRVKFLTWMINKFGDQEIRVVCYVR